MSEFMLKTRINNVKISASKTNSIQRKNYLFFNPYHFLFYFDIFYPFFYLNITYFFIKQHYLISEEC